MTEESAAMTDGQSRPPMRRKDRKMQEQGTMDALIERSRVCRLALADGDQPYVIPMNFGYEDRCLYLHSALTGRKLDILRKNKRVCVEFDECLDIIAGESPCDTSCRYNSVIAFGEAEFLSSGEDKNAALKLITRHYSGQDRDFDARQLASVEVIKIVLTAMSGKSSTGG
jgi:nitroimidazol reductase NimA-like FMN-containing flavoprotein (pyridoxamine 5'-phosphate oxidase superfamily)